MHVHDEPVERAAAGQRVALNLAGLAVHEAARGDAVTDPVRGPGATYRLDAALTLAGEPPARVQLHHGTRDVAARLVRLDTDRWQARLERPLLAAVGDHVVIRSIAPPDTLGGGVVLDTHPSRGRPSAPPPPAPSAPSHRHTPPPMARLTAAATELEARLRAAGHEPPADDSLDASALNALRDAGRAVRVGRSMYAHPDALAAVRRRVEAIIDAEGAITMARLRDDLGTSRKYAQALLEHLDAARVTLRLPDDRRVLRRRSAG